MQPRTLEQLVESEAAARLVAFRDAVLHAFPGAVQDVLLFGSRARGDAQPDSDYDVAVVLEYPLALNRNVRCQLADAAWEHVIDGYAIIPLALSPDDLPSDRSRGTELGARIADEGVSLR
ncbi:MAG TPA: nucleotidyltransferase domain-containing protein [Acetobacteraceae bacterium]|nr:nucleotidyltransferase domain-containing protein [Acetobacteraceae bacterium]